MHTVVVVTTTHDVTSTQGVAKYPHCRQRLRKREDVPKQRCQVFNNVSVGGSLILSRASRTLKIVECLTFNVLLHFFLYLQVTQIIDISRCVKVR